MKSVSRRRRSLLALAAVISATTFANAAKADTIYWDGSGTASWNTLASWSTSASGTTDPAAIPGVNDIATFSSTSLTGSGVKTITLDGPQSALGLATINPNNGPFLITLTGGGTDQVLSLGASGISHVRGGLTIGSTTANQKVTISLQDSQTWSSSTATGETGTQAIFVLNDVSLGVSGNKTLTLGGSNSGTKVDGVISNGLGTLAITKTGSATSVWTLNGANTYTGITTISGGVLSVAILANGTVASGLGASDSSAGNLLIGNGATLRYVGGSTANTDRSFTVTGTGAGATFGIENSHASSVLNFTTGSIVYATTNETRTLNLGGASTGANTFAPLVADNGSGAVSVTKAGAGRWGLTNASNSYTGTTTINAGNLAVSTLANGGLVSPIGASSNASTNLALNTGFLLYTGAGSTTDRLFSLTGATGGLDASGSGALVFNNTGAITYGAANAVRTLTLQGSNTAANTLAATIGDNGSGVVGLTKGGAGLWTLTNTNSSYTGVTSIGTSGSVLAVQSLANGGSNSSIGASPNAAANLVIGASTTLRYLGTGASTDRLFTSNGAAGTVEASGTGTLNFTNSGNVAWGTIDAARTLTIGGTNTGLNTFLPTLANNGTGAVGLTKSGTGTWLITGNNSFTGASTLSSGAIVIGHKSAFGASTVAFNGASASATSDFTGANAVGNSYTFTTGQIFQGFNSIELSSAVTLGASKTLNNDIVSGKALILSGATLGVGAGTATSATLTLGGTGTTNVTGALTNNVLTGGASGLAYSGAGTAVFSGANTINGTITANSGTMRFDYATNPTVLSVANAMNLSGGATIEFLGNSSGVTAQTIGNVAAAADTGLSRVKVNANGGTSTTITAGTFARASGSFLMLELTGNASLTTTTTTTNGWLNGSGGNLIKDATGRIDFASKSGSAIVALNAGTTLGTSGGAATESRKLDGSLTAAGSITTGTVRIDTTGSGQSLAMGSQALVVGQGLMFVGSNDYTISGSSNIQNGSGGLLFSHFGTGKLTVNMLMGTTGTAVIAGTGLLEYTANTNNTGPKNISGVTLRMSNTDVLGTSNTLLSGGAVLELTASSGDLTRAVGTAASQIQFVGNGGGFGAFGGDRTVNLGGAGATMVWGTTTGFVGNGGTLQLSSATSNSKVTFANALNLGASNRIVNVNNGSASVDADISGVISGTATPHVSALTKTGTGTLVLSNVANSYTGVTNVTAGTLLVNGSTATSSNTIVASGATLGGSGTTGPVTLSSGATLSPGNSPGSLNTGSTTWVTGANYNWQGYDLTSSTPSGTNFDSQVISGTLNIQTGFNFNMWSLSDSTPNPDANGNAIGFSNAGNGFWRVASATGGITGAGNLGAPILTASNGTGGFTNSLAGGSFSLVLGGTSGAPGSANDLYLKFTAAVVAAPDLVAGAVTGGNLFVLQNANLTTATASVALSNNNAGAGTVTSATIGGGAPLTATVSQVINGATVTPPSSTISLTSTATPITALNSTVTYNTNPTDSNPGNNTATVNVRIGNAPLDTTDSTTTFGAALIAATPANANPVLATFANLSSNTSGQNSTSAVPALHSTATILNYVNTTAGDSGIVSMRWRSRTADEASSISGLNDNGNKVNGYLLSDVVDLTGMTNLDGFTDTFVLQMSYDLALLDGHEAAGVNHGNIFIVSKDGPDWVNAVLGNNGGTPNYVGDVDYNPNIHGLGTFGIDVSTHTVWAVLNHNSEFAVIPEPSTLVVGGLALLGFAGVGLRRRRLAKQQA